MRRQKGKEREREKERGILRVSSFSATYYEYTVKTFLLLYILYHPGTYFHLYQRRNRSAKRSKATASSFGTFCSWEAPTSSLETREYAKQMSPIDALAKDFLEE
mmetsp:Transcript_1243/g.4589  ORF Transcript_1243/g.4589 Transcript_1243/m.4589 type:complete len:104 (+) Transcript_1243:937-1248(+)